MFELVEISIRFPYNTNYKYKFVDPKLVLDQLCDRFQNVIEDRYM